MKSQADTSVPFDYKRSRILIQKSLPRLILFLLLSGRMGLGASPIETQIDSFLRRYTTRTGVRYAKLKANPELKHIYDGLRSMPLPASRPAQEAYWINLYNIATIKLIADHYPVKSITSLHLAGSTIIGHVTGRTIWKTWKFRVRGKEMTLDKIEHAILRPRFRDFRIHAALVCAARSCPPLRREAYRGSRLEQQLEEQMHLWLADRSKNRYDKKTHTLYLSKIFSWFQSDFTHQGKRKLLNVILPYLPQATQRTIRLRKDAPRIRYLPYNWALNKS